MALNEEYMKKIKCYLEHIPKRIYKPIKSTEFAGFVTKERLTLDEAGSREKTAFA